jgi:endonuclease/exonuclease/phosphatase family metal-dependent hydrolase
MRLATFNILHGRALHDGVVDLNRLTEAVRILQPDILALQEVDRAQPRSHLADLTGVAAEAMGAETHRFVAAMAGVHGTWAAATESDLPDAASYGIALLSRYPVRRWEVVRLPRIPFRFPLYLPGPRKVIVVDEEPRTAVIGHLDTPAGPVAVANTHLSFVPGWGPWQLVGLRRRLARIPGPVLLMGDLNLSGRWPARVLGYRGLASHLTFPWGDPDRQLDHILLRGDFGRVVHSEAPALPLSDHRALLVDLTF